MLRFYILYSKYVWRRNGKRCSNGIGYGISTGFGFQSFINNNFCAEIFVIIFQPVDTNGYFIIRRNGKHIIIHCLSFHFYFQSIFQVLWIDAIIKKKIKLWYSGSTGFPYPGDLRIIQGKIRSMKIYFITIFYIIVLTESQHCVFNLCIISSSRVEWLRRGKNQLIRALPTKLSLYGWIKRNIIRRIPGIEHGIFYHALIKAEN